MNLNWAKKEAQFRDVFSKIFVICVAMCNVISFLLNISEKLGCCFMAAFACVCVCVFCCCCLFNKELFKFISAHNDNYEFVR